MIRSFRNKDTARLFRGICPPRLTAVRVAAERKLAMIDAATTIGFLRSPPSNRLERLSADRAGQWSIRINDQWRVCFRFEKGDALDVEIVDYH